MSERHEKPNFYPAGIRLGNYSLKKHIQEPPQVRKTPNSFEHDPHSESRESESSAPGPGLSFKEKLKLKLTQRRDETCHCADCDKFLNCIKWKTENTTFPKGNGDGNIPLLQKDQNSELFKMNNTEMLLNGPCVPLVPKPIDSVDKTILPDDIQEVLKQEKLGIPTMLQSFAWKLIPRGVNMFMIGPKKSGKTLSYLPFLCYYTLHKEDRFHGILNHQGPFILILCNKIKSCYDFHSLIQIINPHCPVEILNDENVKEKNCDILLTTPSILEESLKSGRIKLYRLSIVVLEDANFLLKTHPNSITNILKISNLIQMNRNCQKCIQVIVGADEWTEDLTLLLNTLNPTPFVYFEDFLQAAIYSKVVFVKKKLMEVEHRISYLVDVLKQHYNTKRTVVIIEEDDSVQLCQFIQHSGIEVISLSSSLEEDEVIQNANLWKSLPVGQFQILLCSDAMFHKAGNIRKAEWLVHYYLPNDFGVFRTRFRAFGDNLSSPLEVSDVKLKTFLFFCQKLNQQSYEEFWINFQLNLIPHLTL